MNKLRILGLMICLLLSATCAKATDAKAASDAKATYDPNGHFYAAMCAVDIARLHNPSLPGSNEIAFYTELPDMLTYASAYYGGYSAFEAAINLFTVSLVFRDFDRVQRNIHSLCGGEASIRQACLADLISKELNSEHPKNWRLGFLLHAYGDAFAHSYPDDNKFILDPNPAPHWKTWIPNPNYGKRYLYRAPLGHGLYGHGPDQVRSDTNLFCHYFMQVTALLNKGPLDYEQKQHAESFLTNVIQQLEATNADESSVFRQVLGLSTTTNGYNPDATPWNKVLSRKDFEKLKLTDLGFKVELPTHAEVQALAKEIQAASEAWSKEHKQAALPAPTFVRHQEIHRPVPLAVSSTSGT